MEWKIVNYLCKAEDNINFLDEEEMKKYLWDRLSPEEQREASDKIHRRLAEVFGLRIKEEKTR